MKPLLQAQLEEIKLSALDLEDGSTITVFCPFCRAQHEDKLSVTRSGSSLMYYCHRASCHKSGIIGERGDFQRLKGKKRNFNPKTYEEAICTLSPSTVELVRSRYGISSDVLLENGVRQSLNGEWLLFPLYMDGKMCGITSKYIGKSEPSTKKGWKKSILYRTQDVGALYIPIKTPNASPIYLVEGCLDALKLTELGVRSIALLGTHVSPEQALRIKQMCTSVIWMLDPDATNTAHKLAKQYRLLLNSTVVPMSADPKDTPLEELKTMLITGE